MANHTDSRPAYLRDLPEAHGLYDPRFEHDACGVGFVVDMQGRKSRTLVEQAFQSLCNLDHRGAAGAEIDTGDGAGVLIQVPDKFLRAVVDFELPVAGAYATGMAFVPVDADACRASLEDIDKIFKDEGFDVLGWRVVPVDATVPGKTAAEAMPAFRQVFVTKNSLTGIELERHVWCARKRIEHEAGVYFPSLSARTMVFKGMLTSPQVREFFLDLHDERLESAIVLLHSRFSTNTFPSWPLAHPYRVVAHNGEINTVQGNQNWMRARRQYGE